MLKQLHMLPKFKKKTPAQLEKSQSFLELLAKLDDSAGAIDDEEAAEDALLAGGGVHGACWPTRAPSGGRSPSGRRATGRATGLCRGCAPQTR